MKIINFKLKNKAQSVNSGYYKSRVRTHATRKWSESIHAQLAAPSLKKEVEAFTNAFKPLKHSIRLTLRFYIPREKFYTKKGYVSRSSGDLDNNLKLLIDTLFDPRFFKRDLFNLNIDDQFITELITSKHPADLYSIGVEVELIPLY